MSAVAPTDEGKSVPFTRVLEEELKVLAAARQNRQAPGSDRPLEKDLIGLAFSGGGIRSATFNLGVIQALAGNHLLGWIDYLSTVSGGGYIGSWLSSWSYYVGAQEPATRNHISRIETELNRKPQNFGDISEPHQVHFLRRYSNYLTPRLGVLSGDTLAFIGIYIRNLVLNQTILIFALLALLGVPRALGLVFHFYAGPLSMWICGALTLALLVWISVAVSRNMDPARANTSGYVIRWIAVPLFLFCLIVTYAVWQLVNFDGGLGDLLLNTDPIPVLLMIGIAALIYAVPWLIAGAFLPATEVMSQLSSSQKPQPVRRDFRLFHGLWAFPAGAVAGALFLLLSHLLAHWGTDNLDSIWWVLTLGVPLATVLTLLVGVLHLGLIGRNYDDAFREWWGRLGGVVLAIMVCWFLVCLATLLFPHWLSLWWDRLLHPDQKSPAWVTMLWRILTGLGIPAALGTWAGATIRGLVAANSSKTGGCAPAPNSGMSEDRWARLAPPIFAIGLILILSVVLNFLVVAATGNALHFDAMGIDLDDLEQTDYGRVLALLLALYAASRFLGWRVDVNEFSMHNAYRNRLVRCYLGATNPWRRPHPFTGFDENDNIFLHWLLPLGAPFHILNATLNVVKGKELALQTRKARSFVFTPLYSGFDFTQDETVGKMPGGMKSPAEVLLTSDPMVTKPGAYRLTRHASWQSRYPGARLGTAMAISGAAASPNMGQYTTRAVSFLLTIFCVRLGWWFGNPRDKKCWESGSPRSSWKALVNELTGSTNEDQCEVYLSDGGHFDNLGVYELVHRRCRLIIASDAGADLSYACNDLASLIEKCRVDFATEIEIDLTEIFPTLPLPPDGGPTLRLSKSPFAVGKISYPDGSQGILIYIKPSLNANLPKDVLAYARLQQTFPHQSTMDQFFDENQFESYRELGFACAGAAVEQIKTALAS